MMGWSQISQCNNTYGKNFIGENSCSPLSDFSKCWICSAFFYLNFWVIYIWVHTIIFHSIYFHNGFISMAACI
jgi:hypothetical protein